MTAGGAPTRRCVGCDAMPSRADRTTLRRHRAGIRECAGVVPPGAAPGLAA